MVALCNHLKEELLLVDFSPQSKEQALTHLVRTVRELGYLTDEEKLLEALLEREAIKSTGVGHGIAVPHTSSAELQETLLGIAQVPNGMDYDALDGKPVYAIFLLVGPETNRNVHLQLLAKISRILTQTDCLDKIRRATGPSQVYQAMLDAETELP